VTSTRTAHAPPSRTQLVLAFLTLYIVWGSTYLAIKWVVADIPPFFAATMRHGVAGTLLFCWASVRGVRWPTRAELRVALVVGTLLLAVGNGLVNWAGTRVPSGLTSLIVASLPIWMVALEWWREGVVPRRRTMIGVAIGSAGIAALVWTAGGIGAARGSLLSTLLGTGALLMASFSWAVGSFFSRRAARHPDGVFATSLEMLSASGVLLVVSLLSGDLAAFAPAAVGPRAWMALAYLIVFGSVMGFSAYTFLLRVTSPSKVSTYAYVNPLVAVFLGTTLGGEPLTPGLLIAAGLVLGAVVLITLPTGRLARRTVGVQRPQ
jgi:drug/metabolite transporter (DMT)-like permease